MSFPVAMSDRSGHRFVSHTADLRIEAWSPTREGCVREAVLGAVESFLDTSSAVPARSRTSRFEVHRDDDLLADVLDDVIYLLDTAGEAPIDLELRSTDGTVDVHYSMADARTLTQVGAVPKAVSLHGLALCRGGAGWRGSVTLDV